MQNKENAKRDFIKIICNSWTYNKMTEKEQKTICEIIKFSGVVGTYNQRYNILHQLYFAFLQGLGYEGNGTGWRATEEERATMPKF